MNLGDMTEAIDAIDIRQVAKLRVLVEASDCVFMLGNGGSSAIASHMTEDYTKTLKSRALTFSDPARLTCYANDYGYISAYRAWLKEFVPLARKPLVILISSSGNSGNMVCCAQWCDDVDIPFVMLTGFDKNNTMRCNYKHAAQIDMHVDSHDYGIVECTHQVFLHAII